ncbi:MAG: serine/threonine-protein kinase [bacterium]|jgi:predicted Ser/Thr protein kinase
MNYGRYKVLEELGQGSMGIVYKAHDPNLDLVLAVKVLRPECLQGETLVKRFLAEARVLGRLDHPNIVRVYNVDEDQGTVYIAMEFLEGEGLNDLAKRKRLSPEEIAGLGAKIAGALGYAHSKGIVHRDVKPGNILVRPDGNPKVTDFGIARIEDTAEHLRTQAGEILGTPAYMSPEQVLSEPVDGRSDIFSLGIILYELCAGERPFRGDSLGAVFQAITQATPVPLSERNPEIPAALAEAVERCLRRNPADRFQSGEELAAALRGCLRKESPPESAPAGSPGAGRKGMPAWVFIAAIAVLAGAGGGIYQFTRGRDAAPLPSAPASAPKETAGSSLRLSTSPAGAHVFLDGVSKGVSPLRMEASPGKHEVRITLAGYEEWEAQVDLAQGSEVPLDVELVRSEAPAPKARSMAKPIEKPMAKPIEKPMAKPIAKPMADPAVRKDLEEGIRSYEQGKIDVSIVKLEYVLRQDPENAKAKQYLAMAQERKRKVMEQWGKQLDEAPVSGGKKR